MKTDPAPGDEVTGGRYRARLAQSSRDHDAVQALRAARFRGDCQSGLRADADDHDGRALHMLIEDSRSGRLCCSYRLMRFASGSEIGGSYSAQFYDLSALARAPGPMLEMGRFCVASGPVEPDVLRLAWATVAGHVAHGGMRFVFGCSSFEGTEGARHADAFALLRERHLAPCRWRPQVKAAMVVRLGEKLRSGPPDLRAGKRAMPPLLRTYLAMGGRVSDHAVVDADLGTLHVFTGLEMRAIPARRARLMRPGAPG